MDNRFYTNYTDIKFIDKLKENLDLCDAFYFSVSFIKKPGLRLLAHNIEAAIARGAKGKVITSTYQNFTDIDSLLFFNELSKKYPNRFECRLDKDCFSDSNGNTVGFHSKGYLFEFNGVKELLVGSSNITVYALLKNVEWDVSIIDDGKTGTYSAAKKEFDYLWDNTNPLTDAIISEYRTRLYYSIERWDMDYSIANAEVKPNYMQRRALKEINRIRAIGASKALVVASAGSGKTFLAAFDAFNFNPRRLLYVVHESSILIKAYETFQMVFEGAQSKDIDSRHTYGIYNKDNKEFDRDFVFSTNITMANSLELFNKNDFDYIVIDECHHSTRDTYKKIISYFKPQFLLGITATPERMDGDDVFSIFDQNVPYELRLRDAIVNGLVVPFKYYGIRDEMIEYGYEETKSHSFVEQFADEKNCDFISEMIEKYRVPGQKLKALAFCRDISHATRMSQAMADCGYETRCLTGKNSVGERIRTYNDLQDDGAGLQILFTVDILNEGVDIPGVNMVIFMRPTDSQTIFIQQLGRGLRKYEGKEYVTVLDFIGNDYKRSVQIAFALGSLSKNFVLERNLIASLVKDNFSSLGLRDYGVEISIDDLSKKEILGFIDSVNFNTKRFLSQDYDNFKKYIRSETYPRHVDYLNNDYAPDLIKYLQSKINNKKSSSYYTFLRAIGEKNLPSFDSKQESFIKYMSEMLPLVRPYEYMIIQRLIYQAGKEDLNVIECLLKNEIRDWNQGAYRHALKYMLKSGFFINENNMLLLNGIRLDVIFEDYIKDLIDYGLGRYDIDFYSIKNDSPFCLWAKYRKEQVQQLLLKNPKDIMTGTKIYDRVVYAFVTVLKDKSTKKNLMYRDGYKDKNIFQWETVAKIPNHDLNKLKSSEIMHIFVRKVENENGIQLPFTYIGSGKMKYLKGPEPNGAHLFDVEMDVSAPEDLYYDFLLPAN